MKTRLTRWRTRAKHENNANDDEQHRIMAGLSALRYAISWRVDRMIRNMRFRASLRHLSGPARIPGGRQDVVVIALVRDGMYYLDEFLRYYRALGAGHFIFCDNGSGDGTLSRLADETDVTVLSSQLPWMSIENQFRRHAAQAYCANRWVLYADMDEVFVPPPTGDGSLRDLTVRLDALGATAMLAQMLEMVPEGPLRDWVGADFASCLQGFDRYELTCIAATPYGDHDAIPFGKLIEKNTELGADLKILFGGLRRRVFGETCCLSKHPLVFVGPEVTPAVHPHCSEGVRVAPATALIKHYKFAGDSIARDSDTLARGVSDHGEDALRTRAFEATPDLSLAGSDARKFVGLQPLFDAGFILDWPEKDQ